MKTVDYFFRGSDYFYNKSLPKLTGLQWEDEISLNYRDGKTEEHEKFLSCIVSIVQGEIEDYLDVFDLEISRQEVISFMREYGTEIYFESGEIPFEEISKKTDFDGTICFLPPVALGFLLKEKMKNH